MAAPLRVAFAGTPEFAAVALQALLAAGFEVPLVLSQPDRPAGRGMKLQASPVKQLAVARGIAVAQPRSLRLDGKFPEEAQSGRQALLDARPDVLIVAAYGLILPKWVLDLPRLGCLNIHGSILPRWRGAAPVQRAILAGDGETGVTIMQMDAGLDTGAMRLIETTPVGRKSAGVLTHELAEMGALMMRRVLSELHAFPPVPQPDEGVTYAAKIDKSEARLDFLTSAVQVERQIRAFNPVPGAFFEMEGERYKILAAEVVHPADTAPGAAPGVALDDALAIACNPGAIRAVRVQRAGKPAMDAAELLRGRAIPAGTRLA